MSEPVTSFAPRPLALAAALLLGLLLLLPALAGFPVYPLSHQLPALLIALLALVAQMGLGHLILSRARLLAPGTTAHPLDALMSGLIACGLIVWLFGKAGWLVAPLVWLLLVAGLAAAWPLLRTLSATRPDTPEPAFSRRDGVFGAGALGGTCLLLAYASLPPTLYDGMVNHLALIEQYHLFAELVVYPAHLMSAYPVFGNLLGWAPLALGGPDAVNAFTGLLMLAAVWQVGRIAAGLGRTRAGLVAFALAVSCPLVVYLASDVKNDSALAFFQISALAVLVGPGSARRKTLLAGFALGAALAVKYSTFAALPGFILAAWVLSPAVAPTSRLREIGWLLLVAGLVAAPFYADTLRATGSPLYPGFPAIFGEAAGVDYAAMGREIQKVSSFGELTSLPYRLFFDPFSIDGDHAVLGFAWLMLLPFAFLAPRAGDRRERALWWLLAWQLVPLVLVSTKLRFYPLLILLPPLLLGLRLARIEGRLATRALAIPAALGLFHALALAFALGEIFFPGSARLMAGSLEREEYLRQSLPPYAAFETIREVTAPGGRVVLEGERRFAYLGRPVHEAASPYERGLLTRLHAAGLSGEEAAVALRGAGVRAIYLGHAEGRRLGDAPLPAAFLAGLRRHCPPRFAAEREELLICGDE